MQHPKPITLNTMEYLDNSIRKYKFLKLRQKVYKAQPMGKLEAKIDKFLSETNVNYHRKWAVKLGTPGKKQRRFIASFYLPDVNIMLDMADNQSNMSLYDFTRHKELIWRFGNYPHIVNAILPIDESLSWREVKKQLQVIIKSRTAD